MGKLARPLLLLLVDLLLVMSKDSDGFHQTFWRIVTGKQQTKLTVEEVVGEKIRVIQHNRMINLGISHQLFRKL